MNFWRNILPFNLAKVLSPQSKSAENSMSTSRTETAATSAIVVRDTVRRRAGGRDSGPGSAGEAAGVVSGGGGVVSMDREARRAMRRYPCDHAAPNHRRRCIGIAVPTDPAGGTGANALRFLPGCGRGSGDEMSGRWVGGLRRSARDRGDELAPAGRGAGPRDGPPSVGDPHGACSRGSGR